MQYVIEESKTYIFRPFYYECVDFLSMENEFSSLQRLLS